MSIREGLASPTRKAFKAMSVGVISSGIAAVAALISNVLISRELGPSARGEVGFVLQLAYLIAPLVMLGVDRGLLRPDSEPLGQIARRHLLPCAILITLILLATFRDWRALAGMVAFGASWLAIFRSASMRDHTFKLYLWLAGLYSLGIVSTALVLYLLGSSNWVLWLIPYLVPAVVFAIYDLWRYGVQGYRRLFAGVSRISLRLLPASLGIMVVTRADRVLMPMFSSNAQLGIYVAVATGTEVIVWIAKSLADHRVSHLEPVDRSIGTLLRILIRDFAVFAIIAIFVGGATYFILIPSLGPEYYAGRQLVLPLTLAALAFAVYRQVAAWLLAGRRPGTTTIVDCATALVAVPVYIVFISRGGAEGAAWASLSVYLIGVIIGVTLSVNVARERTSIVN